MIKNNVRCVKNEDKLKLIIYYQSATTRGLVMRNNQAPPCPALQQTNLIYEYKCTKDGCEHLPDVSYVGFTTTTLSRRITMHLGSGAPKKHTEISHRQSPLSREMMVENTKIIRKENDTRRLPIYEALIIQQKCPSINKQDTGLLRTLKLFSSSTTNRRGPLLQQRDTQNPSPPNATTPNNEPSTPAGTEPTRNAQFRGGASNPWTSDHAQSPNNAMELTTLRPTRHHRSPESSPNSATPQSARPRSLPNIATPTPPPPTRNRSPAASQPVFPRSQIENVSPQTTRSQPTPKAQIAPRRSARIRNKTTKSL